MVILVGFNCLCQYPSFGGRYIATSRMFLLYSTSDKNPGEEKEGQAARVCPALERPRQAVLSLICSALPGKEGALPDE